MNPPSELIRKLEADPASKFSMLVDSHASGMATSTGGWEIAVAWDPKLPWLVGLTPGERSNTTIGMSNARLDQSTPILPHTAQHLDCFS